MQRRNDWMAGAGCLVLFVGPLVFWTLVAYAGGWRALVAAALVTIAGAFALAAWDYGPPAAP
ncbi:MAG: hypothetical protein M3Q74_06085 [Pseudomonadota bacterium]|nr:hypothetical protein [Pseudomonadota bacterium]